jgi:hypothetical protein
MYKKGINRYVFFIYWRRFIVGKIKSVKWDKKLAIIETVYDVKLSIDIPIYHIQNKKGFFFTSRIDIDADGAYRACHPC